MENHQNATGTMLCLRRSDVIHWAMNRAVNIAWPRNPTTSHTLGTRSRLMADDLVSQVALLHPADDQKVREGTEDAVPDPVLAAPGPPLAVAHGDLDDPHALDPQERGKKAVHPGVELDPGEALPPERLQRASGVDDVVAREPVPHRVGER